MSGSRTAIAPSAVPAPDTCRRLRPGRPPTVMTAEWFLAALRHDRAVVLGSLALVILVAWVYLLLGAGVEMETMDMGGGQIMLMLPEWSVGYGLVIFVMWAVMMVAMMLPSAAPVTLLVASVARKRRGGWRHRLRYGAVRSRLSRGLVALRRRGDIAAMGPRRGRACCPRRWPSATRLLAGAVLIAAGIYQWTPLKEACLRHCRSPLDFLLHHWRDGALGALVERDWPRRLLPRLLLDADGAAVCRRDHEHRLDRRHRAHRADREDPALGRPDGPGDGRRCWSPGALSRWRWPLEGELS